MVRVGVAERGTVPTVHTPPAYVPWLGAALINAGPAGRLSVMLTFVAVLGPLLARAIVKVTVSPTFGIGSFTVLARARSACCGVTVAPALLLPGSGSNWSDAVTVAVFVPELGPTTV